MIKGLALTPPVVGRISIGGVVEKNGKRIPVKHDEFTITSQVQNPDGTWIPHRYDEGLRKPTSAKKIRTIPIMLLFNDPDLNLRAEYSLFDRKTGRPMCTGNGEQCRRYTANGMESLSCPSPDYCELGKGGLCKPYGRLNVQIGESEEDVETFIFRTTGYNSIRTLAARLHYYRAASGNLLACMPLELNLRAKSTTQSHRTAIYYADISTRGAQSLTETISEAREIDAQRKASGFDQAALDAAGREGFANWAFEDSSEEVSEIVEEFFPGNDSGSGSDTVSISSRKATHQDKLDKKAADAEGDST